MPVGRYHKYGRYLFSITSNNPKNYFSPIHLGDEEQGEAVEGHQAEICDRGRVKQPTINVTSFERILRSNN